MPSEVIAIWFRSDLRCHDNRALSQAVAEANQRGLPLVALYYATPDQWRSHDVSAVQVDFILRHLPPLASSLKALNIPLRAVVQPNFAAIPEHLSDLCRDHGICKVFANREYPVNEIERDRQVAEALEKIGVDTQWCHDFTLLPPGSVRTGQGDIYKVFTPFKRQYIKQLTPEDYAEAPVAPVTVAAPASFATKPPENLDGFKPTQSPEWLAKLWPAGEDAALQRLDKFIDHRLFDYQDQRDFPGLRGTSALSAYLAVGSLSPRATLRAALAANGGEFDSGQEGAKTWIGELIWRDFYQHILTGFPRVSRGLAFQPHTEAVEWRDDPESLAAWRNGRTGIPIVDAAMRQLLDTGWMHNRLRMVTAMFLSKNLLIDWREGERHFRQQLIDGELGSNNGGWQWAASTGTDAAPYFRVFNPVTQGQRFDPQGDFIRRYLPELKSLDDRHIHTPWKAPDFEALGYPAPIVDLKTSRQRAIEAFRSLPGR
ncbi:MAG: deoxyribodipyrimidine photo-lyase [Pseudomonadota bacterium]